MDPLHDHHDCPFTSHHKASDSNTTKITIIMFGQLNLSDRIEILRKDFSPSA